MALHRKSFRTILLSILLGIAVGTLWASCSVSSCRRAFPATCSPTPRASRVTPFTVDLLIFSFTFGFSLTFNLLSVLGIFVMIQLLKWSW